MTELSVIILCYKEGEAVRGFTEEMKRSLNELGASYEIILVANYNEGEEETDKTPQIVKGLAETDPRIHVVSMPKRGKFGWDVKSGFKAATGGTIAFIDGDGQMPAEDVARVYKELKDTSADLVQTFRVKRHDSLERLFISRVYNFLLKLLFPKVSISDANSKPKILTREALESLNLKSDDWFLDAEIVIQATEKNFKIREIPTVFHKNKNRLSFVSLGAIAEFVRNLVNYRFFR